MPIHIVLVDDHALFRAGLRRLLEAEEDIVVVAEACDAAQALVKVRDLRPDIALLDIGMPGMSSFDATRLMRRHSPGTRIVFLTMYDDEEYLLQYREAGGVGYILKDAPAPQLIHALREIYRGSEYLSPVLAKRLRDGEHAFGMGLVSSLTPREREVVKLIAEGNSVRQIAGRLQLSSKTVEAHKFNLMRKLNIHNKAQLVTYAIQKKIVKLPVEA